MTKARLPPLALVVVPALVLAAVGVRAVTAEMSASTDAARERARSIASRLARSVDALVAEYAAPLPPPGTKLTRDEAIARTAHLRPRRALAADGRSLALDHELPHDDAIPQNEAALVEDALARGERLARTANGPLAASDLVEAAAHVVSHPVARARLLYASIRWDRATSPGDERLRIALATGALRRDVDGMPFDLIGMRLFSAALRAGTMREVDVASPVCFRIAEDPYGLDDSQRAAALGEFEIALGGVSAECSTERRAWDAAREAARQMSATAPAAATLLVPPEGATLAGDRTAGPVLAVWTAVEIDGTPALLGGDIPHSILPERLEAEVRALADEPQVAYVRLRTRQGAHAFDRGGRASSERDVVIETAEVPRLADWSAETVVGPETGVPATAWLLGAGLVVTTLALIAGMLALRRAAERSVCLADDRRTFLDHVAHELRTPAAAVQALTEELASGHVPAAREPLYRDHLLRESRRLSSLVEDTLDFARLDAGRLAFRMDPADLRDVVREAVEGSDGAGRVVAHVPDRPIVRPVDSGALRRAVRNLVENAVRHGGGDAPVSVQLSTVNGSAAIAVADRGRGIAAEHLPHLFERFYRVPSATHEAKGVGLGLALVREVARAHGGEVDVESAPGSGSTFTVRIPLARMGHQALR